MARLLDGPGFFRRFLIKNLIMEGFTLDGVVNELNNSLGRLDRELGELFAHAVDHSGAEITLDPLHGARRAQVDRLRPERADWLLTGAMIAPCVGMGYLGLVIAGSAGLAVVGALCALGPVSAAIALRNRAREVRRLEEEL